MDEPESPRAKRAEEFEDGDWVGMHSRQPCGALPDPLLLSVQLGVLEVVEKVEGEREEKPAAAEAEHDTIHE